MQTTLRIIGSSLGKTATPADSKVVSHLMLMRGFLFLKYDLVLKRGYGISSKYQGGRSWGEYSFYVTGSIDDPNVAVKDFFGFDYSDEELTELGIPPDGIDYARQVFEDLRDLKKGYLGTGSWIEDELSSIYPEHGGEEYNSSQPFLDCYLVKKVVEGKSLFGEQFDKEVEYSFDAPEEHALINLECIDAHIPGNVNFFD